MLLDPALGYRDEGLDLREGALYDRARAAFGEAETLPPTAYRSKVFSSLEDERVWARSWVAVGVRQQIPQAGDLLPFTVGYHGVHLQRQEGGEIVGRFNKAQHGGCRSVPLQCQTGSRTRCSFTSCGFSRDRDVIASADLEGDAVTAHQYLGLRPERLIPVPLAEWGPLLFVCLDPRVPSLAERLKDCHHPIARLGESAWHLAGTRWLGVAANWKLVAPALGECLAGPRPGEPSAAIPGFSRQAFLAPERAPGFGEGFGEGPSARAWLLWLYPNLILAVRDGVAAVILLQPLSMSETQVRLHLLVSEASVEAPRILSDWQRTIEIGGAAAGRLQEALGRWGTPAAPASDPQGAPVQTSDLGWAFQSYLVERILEEA